MLFKKKLSNFRNHKIWIKKNKISFNVILNPFFCSLDSTFSIIIVFRFHLPSQNGSLQPKERKTTNQKKKTWEAPHLINKKDESCCKQLWQFFVTFLQIWFFSEFFFSKKEFVINYFFSKWFFTKWKINSPPRKSLPQCLCLNLLPFKCSMFLEYVLQLKKTCFHSKEKKRGPINNKLQPIDMIS